MWKTTPTKGDPLQTRFSKILRGLYKVFRGCSEGFGGFSTDFRIFSGFSEGFLVLRTLADLLYLWPYYYVLFLAFIFYCLLFAT